MLKTMRRNVKSLKPILWLIVATFIIAIFAIWGGAGRLGETNRSNALASVGGAKITADEYFQALRTRLEAIRKQFGGDLNAGLIQQLGIPQQTLEQLVQQRLLLQIAADMGLRATDAEVRAKIVAFPALQQNGQFVGFEDYRRILDYNHIDLADFEAGLRQEVLIGKVVGVLTAGLFVTDDEVWESYRKQNDSAKIEYLVAETAKTEIAAAPAEAELRAHFDKNAAGYKMPERRTADYVVLRTADLKKEVAVKDDEISKYYRDNTAQFQEPETAQASRIWLPFTATDKEAVLAQARSVQKRAAGGEDFAALAKAFSKDDKAAAGGDWGLYDWRSLTAPETEAVGKLDQGGVSDVVETDAGAAVFKVTAKTAALTKSLAEVSATIKGILEEEKARALVAERMPAAREAGPQGEEPRRRRAEGGPQAGLDRRAQEGRSAGRFRFVRGRQRVPVRAQGEGHLRPHLHLRGRGPGRAQDGRTGAPGHVRRGPRPGRHGHPRHPQEGKGPGQAPGGPGVAQGRLERGLDQAQARVQVRRGPQEGAVPGSRRRPGRGRPPRLQPAPQAGQRAGGRGRRLRPLPRPRAEGGDPGGVRQGQGHRAGHPPRREEEQVPPVLHGQGPRGEEGQGRRRGLPAPHRRRAFEVHQDVLSLTA